MTAIRSRSTVGHHSGCWSKASPTDEWTHTGSRYQVVDYRPQILPRQRPYPPLWYATANPDSAAWLGRHAFNVLTWGIGPEGRTNAGRFVTQYREALNMHVGDPGRLNAHVARPRRGVMQHVYIADSDAQARREAGAALEVAELAGPAGVPEAQTAWIKGKA
jgi:alkanesulfonate monooxygenase SsuD/methylene tetrahydromethanopterin reductase-like flavin-dependent oxidoreductase (luciferase family)